MTSSCTVEPCLNVAAGGEGGSIQRIGGLTTHRPTHSEGGGGEHHPGGWWADDPPTNPQLAMAPRRMTCAMTQPATAGLEALLPAAAPPLMGVPAETCFPGPLPACPPAFGPTPTCTPWPSTPLPNPAPRPPWMGPGFMNRVSPTPCHSGESPHSVCLLLGHLRCPFSPVTLYPPPAASDRRRPVGPLLLLQAGAAWGC